LSNGHSIFFKNDVLKRNWYINGQTNLAETLDSELLQMGHESVVDTYPIGIAHKLIAMFCPPDGVVYDPFGGSGVTAQAALENKLVFITNDVSPEQTKLAEKRIEMYLQKPEYYGTL
jgi:site-specific DNA-methyltransferase (adenine-specific)